MSNTLNIRAVNTCAAPDCGIPVEYRTVGRTGNFREWLHEGEVRVSLVGPSTEGGRGHSARPTYLCADCGGPITTWQDAWANYTGCVPCRTESRYSIGD